MRNINLTVNQNISINYHDSTDLTIRLYSRKLSDGIEVSLLHQISFIIQYILSPILSTSYNAIIFPTLICSVPFFENVARHGLNLTRVGKKSKYTGNLAMNLIYRLVVTALIIWVSFAAKSTFAPCNCMYR